MMHVWWLTLLRVLYSTWGWDCGKQERGDESIEGFTCLLHELFPVVDDRKTPPAKVAEDQDHLGH